MIITDNNHVTLKDNPDYFAVDVLEEVKPLSQNEITNIDLKGNETNSSTNNYLFKHNSFEGNDIKTNHKHQFQHSEGTELSTKLNKENLSKDTLQKPLEEKNNTLSSTLISSPINNIIIESSTNLDHSNNDTILNHEPKLDLVSPLKNDIAEEESKKVAKLNDCIVETNENNSLSDEKKNANNKTKNQHIVKNTDSSIKQETNASEDDQSIIEKNQDVKNLKNEEQLLETIQCTNILNPWSSIPCSIKNMEMKRHYTPPVINEPDPERENIFFNTREEFLHLCQTNHYQFDELRRAKNSTTMILYYLLNSLEIHFPLFCTLCQQRINSAFWQECHSCENFSICQSCSARNKHEHKLFYHESIKNNFTLKDFISTHF